MSTPTLTFAELLEIQMSRVDAAEADYAADRTGYATVEIEKIELADTLLGEIRKTTARAVLEQLPKAAPARAAHRPLKQRRRA